MKSEIEKYATQKLRELQKIIRLRDRGVVVGAVLSFIPIFPACTIGFAISVVNFLLIRKGRLSRSEDGPVKLSLAVGFLNSIGWIYILLYFGRELLPAVGNIVDVLFAPLNMFGIEFLDHGRTSGIDV